jgi:CRISPR-associated endonuclease Cas1
MLTIEALKWASSQNITIRILTNRGEHLATIFPSPDAPQALGIPRQENGKPDVQLRRAQYNLQPSGRDVPLARAIILRKLEAQWTCLEKHPELPDRERAYEALKVAHSWLSLDPPTKATSTLDGVRLYEARAANMYFAAWRGLHLKLDASAQKRWPEPWKTVSERRSPLTRWMSPRQAVNPAQAMLNFAYSMLESQTRQALNAIGADVACAVVHADRDARDSLVFDILEPLRGLVDDLFLSFLGEHTFSAGDFSVMSTGAVTVHPSLCKVLAEMVRVPQRQADDEARWFRSQLVDMDLRALRRKPKHNTGDDEETEG